MRRPNARSRARNHARGLTLLEVVVASGILSTLFLGVGALFSGSTSQTRIIQHEALVSRKALEIIDVCRSIPFGRPGDSALDETKLVELFDADPELGRTDGATLSAVVITAAATPNNGKILLPTTNSGYFPDGFDVDGTFIVRAATAGATLLSGATAVDPNLSSLLRTGTVPNAAAIRVSVSFLPEGRTTERRLLETVVVARDPEGVGP